VAFTYPIKIVQQQGKKLIWDGIRKKYIVCTPEEIVRQELIQLLIEQFAYPRACFSVEKKIKIGNRQLRYDIIVYKDIHPWLLVECKAPQHNIDAKIFLQSLVYQESVTAQYVMLCNGIKTICMDIENKQWMEAIPEYK
jgi:hypothetical protein